MFLDLPLLKNICMLFLQEKAIFVHLFIHFTLPIEQRFLLLQIVSRWASLFKLKTNADQWVLISASLHIDRDKGLTRFASDMCLNYRNCLFYTVKSRGRIPFRKWFLNLVIYWLSILGNKYDKIIMVFQSYLFVLKFIWLCKSWHIELLCGVWCAISVFALKALKPKVNKTLSLFFVLALFKKEYILLFISVVENLVNLLVIPVSGRIVGCLRLNCDLPLERNKLDTDLSQFGNVYLFVLNIQMLIPFIFGTQWGFSDKIISQNCQCLKPFDGMCIS